jgi:ACR3 family arsenite efflux pump ArsB
MFMRPFDELPEGIKALHLVAVMLSVLAIVLLITPAAYHRIVERGEETEHFHAVASSLVLAAIVPLSLALSSDLAVVVWKLFASAALAAAFGVGTAAMFLGTWFGSTLRAHTRRRSARA